MGRFDIAGRGLALACMLMTCGMAQAQGDPARWHSEDTSREGRLRILQKEIGAAYEEQKKACRAGPAGEREACLRQARQTWQDDLKNAPAQLDAAPAGSVTTTREVTVGAQR